MTIKEHFRTAKLLTKLLDSQFQVLGIKFGIDPIIGLIPALGNMVTTLTSGYLFWLAWKVQVPGWVYVEMLVNIGLDALITAVPLLGNIFDIFYKANEKNLKLLTRFIEPDVLEGKLLS